jgi:hypothetical protein
MSHFQERDQAVRTRTTPTRRRLDPSGRVEVGSERRGVLGHRKADFLQGAEDDHFRSRTFLRSTRKAITPTVKTLWPEMTRA